MELTSLGKAEEYVDTIQESLHEIDQVGDQKKGNLLSYISNAKTGQHIVNSVVHRHLETVKGLSLNKHKCFMHPLDSFNKTYEEVLKENVLKDKYMYSKNFYALRGKLMTQTFMMYKQTIP